MSTSIELDYTRAIQRRIVWDETRTAAARLLALGYDKQYVANEVGIARATVYAWIDDPEFSMEVDRLTLMLGIANRAERIRVAMRVVRSRIDQDGIPKSDKDLLEWLKFAQSETQGARIDFGKLLELATDDTEAPGQPQLSSSLESPAIDVAPDIDHLALPDAVPTGDDEHNR